MTGVIATIPKYQFSSNGIPMVGGTLTTYITGTSTPSTTWADFAQTTANANPITLDSRGECVLFLDGSVSYRFVLKNSSGVTQWTQDNVGGAGGSQSYLTSVSGTNAITASLAGVSAYAAGLMVTFTAAGSNTGATTININSLGVVNLVRADGVALSNGDILSGGTYEAIYDGTSFKLQGTLLASQLISTAKNKIINSNFSVNQRAVSGTVTLSAGVYGHDRWKAGAGGCTYTFATTANVTTITITAGTLQQVVEGSQLFSGTHCLSWVGTATGRIDSGSYGASGVTGTATGGANMTVEFGTGTVSKVQLEQAGVPSTWNLYNGLYGNDFMGCQRYYEVGATYAGPLATGSTAYLSVNFLVKKRAAPTVTATASTAISGGGTGTTSGAPITGDYFTLYNSTNAAIGATWTANGEL
jgi:hypothetical protein